MLFGRGVGGGVGIDFSGYPLTIRRLQNLASSLERLPLSVAAKAKSEETKSMANANTIELNFMVYDESCSTGDLQSSESYTSVSTSTAFWFCG